MIELLVLAGIAVFLILKLKSVLGTREGFEKPPLPVPAQTSPAEKAREKFEVIEGGADLDITDHVDADSDAAKALAEMKRVDPDFNVTEFLGGARGAYEMILMAFELGELDEVEPFLSGDVLEAFESVIEQREKEGLLVQANFVGVREMTLLDAEFDKDTKEGELKVRFVGELTSVVRDAAGDVVEGDPNAIKRQKDIWTFARIMGSDDPNWQLVATGE
ncbi:putative lipid-binding transport protein (Tim44 family) [Litoreibacter ponti]|uniref:Putative lipid-binding transport protein (Tim44 family) n=1 Tax=Litoreibacter ponti TaxID=1510457 RepID=A0A2T6BP78_9RHOB|nr:Tim44/TimA family putative adaptor protein [Litoreibacter ponti]PTX57875.1 putative lipid-binding transport protein (Tim44 family) [Litoreibacter ponti]